MAAILAIKGQADVLRALDELDGRERQNALRRGVRAAAKPFQAALKEVAATADVPRSFINVPAAKVSTRGGSSGREVEARVRPRSPLFNIFEPGAREHPIAPRRAAALSGPADAGGWDAKGRKRRAPFFSRDGVRHPGMAARPILPAAFAAGVTRAEDALAAAIFGTTS
jgi:hypothetical protein